MTMTIRAVYAGGVLRPTEPLALEEGATVEITVGKTTPTDNSQPDQEIVRKLSEAKTIAEWVAATKLLPSDDGDYDIVKALNENRVWSGERPLVPGEGMPS